MLGSYQLKTKLTLALLLLTVLGAGSILFKVYGGSGILAYLDTEQSYLTALHSSNILLQKEAIFYLGEDKNRAAVPDLLAILKSSPIRSIRLETIKALGKIGDKQACLELMEQTRDPDPELSAAACNSLGQLKARSALQTLLKIARNGKSPLQVRLAAIWALGNIGEQGAVPLLERLLTDKNKYIAFNAARSLKAIGRVQGSTSRP